MELDIEKPYVIGLDMGGTNSVFGIVDQRGNIKSQTVISTKAYPDFREYVEAAFEALQPALDQVGGIQNIRAMGIGAPDANYYTGNIENAANLAWKGVIPCAQIFEEVFGIRLVLKRKRRVWAAEEEKYGF